MTSQPGAERPTGKSPRRAVRRAGTVGTDDTILVSTLPAFPTDAPRTPAQASTPHAPAPRASAAAGSAAHAAAAHAPAAQAPASTPDPAVALRSADDSDVGWGGGSIDSNDDRLHRDKPPHW
ncbi:hypothetical protein Cch01nite_04560 [Cellulomonas chitinilytica]|uniref:Uncharacterized protein n=1 Tax=Cellulomonas chitinilytica TaxID=398759 RepID=A0A919U0P5_9CELL|nr:hypothetical protein [Cellulomonas chitinilytica]GIG19732.1 hypothetical protein Cch01nite_04560 [Cellulomonas chitinilytica]